MVRSFIAIAAVLVGLAASPAYAVVDFATLYAASSGSISIPAEGATLTSAVTINQQTTVTGPGALAISGNGKLTVQQPLTLAGINVTWTKTVSGSPSPMAIQVNGGGLVLDTVNITFNVTPSPLPDQSAGVTAWFLRITGTGSQILIAKTTVRGNVTYGAGFLYADNVDGYASTRIIGNVFNYLHGGVYVNGGNNVEISENAFNRVSFGNIVTSGTDNLTIAGNTLTRSGNGTSGDALTIVGGNNIWIKRNSIFGASCYGMNIRGAAGSTMGPLYVEDNIISGGLTTAYYFWGLSNGGIDGLWFRRNAAMNNGGWGLATQYATDITAEENEFQGNYTVEGWRQHIFMTGTGLERWADNRRGFAYPSNWTPTPYQFPYYVNYPFQ